MDFEYLSEQQLKGFEKYKYNSLDTSPLSKYVMHPFWNQVVKIIPEWLAPNVLTFTGFLFTVLNAFLLTFYDYGFCASSDIPNCAPIPSWVWLVCAVSHFLAHTLDGIDGKQARKTKSSGPLGELFDHGLDSWTSLFIPFCIYSMFGRGENSYEPIRMLFMFWAIFSTFYFSHWEKYNTGILYLPWSYDVSQLILFIMYIATYVRTYTVWKFTLPVFSVSSGLMFEFFSHVGSFGISIPIAFYNVYVAYRSNSLKHSTIYECILPLVSLVFLFAITSFWALYSPSNIINRDPRVFYFMLGTVFSNIACRLIVSQMSSTRCETVNWMLIPLSLIVFGIFQFEVLTKFELTLLRLWTLFVTLCHIHYGVCIVRQMCRHFRIHCFTLKKPEDTNHTRNSK